MWVNGPPARAVRVCGSKAPASEDDLRKLQKLRTQGLSHVKIAARLGYSPGWVMQNLRRLHQHGPRKSADERKQARNERIAKAENLLVEGMSYREIARTMDTSYNTVRRLLGKC